MSRIADILQNAKDTLAPNGRWDDDRLLRLIDAAHKRICLQTGILRGYSNIPLIMHQPFYSLPAAAHRLVRVLYQGTSIPLVSHDYLDKTMGYGWEKHVGNSVQAIVYTLANTGNLRVYPIPAADSILVDPAEGVTVDSESYDIDSMFGVLTDVETDDSPMFNGDILTAYYLMQPETITSVNDDLAISSAFDSAIKFYVTGMALKDNQDTQSRSAAMDELSFFESELRFVTREATLDNTGNAGVFTPTYNGGFDG